MTTGYVPSPPTAELPPAPPPVEIDSRVGLGISRLRHWGLKSSLALLDQGLFSGSGFLVNLLLARWLGPASYGAFAVAFAVFLFISGFHNVLLLEPLAVMGPGRHSTFLPAYFQAQLAVHFVLVGALAVVGLIGGTVFWRIEPDSPLTGAIFGSAFVLPVLLLLWLVRRMCYVLERPSVAAAGSAVYLLLVVGGLSALRKAYWISPFFSAFLLMGVASLIASGALLASLGLYKHSQTQSVLSWRTVLLENWSYGRWLVGSAILYSVSSQMQMFLVAGVLGLSTAGVSSGHAVAFTPHDASNYSHGPSHSSDLVQGFCKTANRGYAA